jgi:hypothetical protein
METKGKTCRPINPGPAGRCEATTRARVHDVPRPTPTPGLVVRPPGPRGGGCWVYGCCHAGSWELGTRPHGVGEVGLPGVHVTEATDGPARPLRGRRMTSPLTPAGGRLTGGAAGGGGWLVATSTCHGMAWRWRSGGGGSRASIEPGPCMIVPASAREILSMVPLPLRMHVDEHGVAVRDGGTDSIPAGCSEAP